LSRGGDGTTAEAIPPYDLHDNAPLLILKRASGLYDDLCDALERADPEDNEYCLVLSNFADDCYAFISEIKKCREP
jgi:hypothetical protein